MGPPPGFSAGIRRFFETDPLLAVAVAAALIALATTPIAFAVLGRMDWFKARRGRVMQRPEFWSVVCSMLLVMGIPAIFALLALKSRSFDEDRYEFDPNRTLSVLDQGRQYRSLKEADDAVRAERARLNQKEQDLLNAVRKLDEAMLTLRSAAQQHPGTYQALPGVLDRLATIHQAVGLDAPQQLINLTAPPASLAGNATPPPANPSAAPVAPTVAAPAAAPGGLSQAEVDAELATVPAPQRALAALLPLTDVSPGWVVAKSGERHIETFNAENLFEKIDGRAESFIQYDVVGMAYTYYHPLGDESSEAQLYIFEMKDALKAFGKYGSEKPEDVQVAPLGSDGYTTAGSVFFYSGPYYVQVITTSDDPKVAAFALDLAKNVAQRIRPAKSEGAAVAATPEPSAATPEALFRLLPEGPSRSGEKYVAQDVFGYSFFSDVFLADYDQDGVTWQGFVRPYPDAGSAKAVFEKYLAEVKDFGADIKLLETSDADRMAIGTLDGLTDVVFLKGNALAGANGATDPAKAEAFARAFAKTLPATVPAMDAPPASGPAGDTDEK
jgi:hypothetical protein